MTTTYFSRNQGHGLGPAQNCNARVHVYSTGKTLTIFYFNISSSCPEKVQLTQKLLTHGYVAPRLKSLLQTFYGSHHDLIDRYEISRSLMTMDLFPFTQMLSALYHCQDDVYRTLLYIWVTRQVSYKKQELHTLCEHMCSLSFFGGVRGAKLYRFLCCVLFVFFLCLAYPRLQISFDCPFWICHSVFSNVY